MMRPMNAAAPIRKAGVYLAWIVFCGLLFAARSGAEDPSRRAGRLRNDEAAARAAAVVRREACCRGYEVVHVAWANHGEGAPDARWVVLLDRVPHTALREAKVVEVRASDGAVLAVRAPR